MSFALMFQFICLLCSLPLVIVAQNNNNITLGSNLKAGNASMSPWVSPSGDFAFGFQNVSDGGFLLAIWYNKISDRTITWSANGDELAQQGSTLQLSVNGLVLVDPNGKQLWNRSGGGQVVYAAMLDTGNLVLANENNKIIWQSFDEPTDTLLPTQVMNNGTSLVARFSNTNFSHGRFKLQMQNDGNFVFYTLNWPRNYYTYSAYTAYFSTGTVGSECQVMFNKSGSVYVRNKSEIVIGEVWSGDMDPTVDRYQRAILEFDGVFRRYVYPMSSSANQNWTVKDFVPQDICRNMTREFGGGACGFNSYCQIGDDMRPNCKCPPGYSFFDDNDLLKGCKPDFIAQSCLEEPQQNAQFQLTEMVPSADFVGSDYDLYLAESENDCRNSCLSDCLCAAAVHNSTGCYKKRFPLSNGRVGVDVQSKAFIKVGNISTQTNVTIQGGGGKEMERQPRFLIVSVFLGSSVFFNFLLVTLAVLLLTFYRRKREVKAQEHRGIAGTNMRSFSYTELQEATSEFSEVIGQGAFAIVYKGLLDSEGGKVVAVKKLIESVRENQKEFESEVKAIAITGHRNLVQLVGFCNEEQHRLLVYEYMPNGSIADILFRGQRPNWFRRIKFAFETARGLNYLHEECSIQIIHCDIKPQNVLLDDSFTARISDFGLAKLLKKDQSHTMTDIRGTKGYFAPEWLRSVPRVTAKVDVYSFGILLLEIICCRRCVVADMEDENQIVLADWAYDCYKEGRIDKLVEEDYEAMTDIENVKKLVMVALWCIQEDPSHRPSMNKVVELIKGALEESPPHDLASHIISMNGYSRNSPSFTHEDFKNR